jgi:outer membrane protein
MRSFVHFQFFFQKNPTMGKSLLTALFLLPAFLGFAQQRIGHTNSDQLLMAMPDAKQADASIKTLEEQFRKQIEQKQKAFQEAYGRYMQGIEAGQQPNPTKEKELEAQAKNLERLQEDARTKITQRRKDLFDPIVKRIREAINAVAMEMKLNYVLDESAGNFVPGAMSTDITSAVKQKLGVQ